jgi:DNA-binding CsgD family transcriptional regulator
MELIKNELHGFLEDISKTYPAHSKVNNEFIDILEKPFLQKECVYILDFSKNRITYKNGFKNLLGYENEDITLDFLASKIHEEDKELVNKIRISTATFGLKNPDKKCDYKLSLTYRVKRNDSTYANILNETTIYEADENGKLISILNRLSDISFMRIPIYVNWNVGGNEIDTEAFKKEIYKEYQNFFTKREVEVIRQISKGCTNKLIAVKLNISEHTVATHRKHILKKSKCHNTKELLLFCFKNGIL